MYAIRASFVSLYPGVTLRAKTMTLSGVSTAPSEADILVSELCEMTGLTLSVNHCHARHLAARVCADVSFLLVGAPRNSA